MRERKMNESRPLGDKTSQSWYHVDKGGVLVRSLLGCRQAGVCGQWGHQQGGGELEQAETFVSRGHAGFDAQKAAG